ncbi:MAG: hypothetical protein H6965_11150 [Chromatiaceae bacterium]|nr:hypothetical protein [Chromatiaceae bacterium]
MLRFKIYDQRQPKNRPDVREWLSLFVDFAWRYRSGIAGTLLLYGILAKFCNLKRNKALQERNYFSDMDPKATPAVKHYLESGKVSVTAVFNGSLLHLRTLRLGVRKMR